MTHRSRAQVGMAGWPQLTFAEPATATIDSAVVDLSVCVGPQRRLSTGSPTRFHACKVSREPNSRQRRRDETGGVHGVARRGRNTRAVYLRRAALALHLIWD